MVRSSRFTFVGAVLALALGLGGCAADAVPGPAGPAGDKGADGRDGVDGTNGTNGTDGTSGVDGKDGIDGANMPGSKTVTAFDANALPVSNTAATALSAKISATGKGKLIAISNMDAFCYAGQCDTSGTTAGSYWMSTAQDGSLAQGMAYEYFWLKNEETENTSRTVVFEVAAAGEITVQLRAQASQGSFGVYRRSLTLVFLPES